MLMFMKKHPPLLFSFLVALVLFAGVDAAVTILRAQAPATSGKAPSTQAGAPHGRDAFGGIWDLERDKSQPADGGNGAGGDGGAGNGGPAGGGGRRGGRGGGGFGGGRRGGSGARGGDPDQMQAIINFVRTTLAASDRLTIVVHDTSVGITEPDGVTLTLQTDNKKIDHRAENGLVKYSAKSRWDGMTLVSEIDIDNGPTIERKYELSPGGSELHITSTTSGGGGRQGGGNRTIVQVYERPIEPAPKPPT